MSAERLASAFVPNAARTASIVEPMLLPSVIAADTSQVMMLLNAIVITIAENALDECISAVTRMPITKPIRIEITPRFCTSARNFKSDGSNENVSESPLNPIKRRPNPIMASPMFLQFESFNIVRKNPIPNIGIAKLEILKLKPNSETIHAVIVVPIFAPKMTPTDCVRVSSPALMNETTITVVAPDDCIIIVIARPVRMPTKRFPVIMPKARCSFSPALF